MPIRILRAFAWIIMTLPVTSQAADFVVPEQYIGTYSGLDIASVKNGVPWEDSLTALDIDRNGITLYATRRHHERQWKIHYSNEWLFTPHERCIGIKRHVKIEGSEFLQLAFALCFEELDGEGVRRMRMTDQMAEPLGVYIRNTVIDPARVMWRLRDTFDDLSAQARAELVPPPSAREVLADVTSTDSLKKIMALKRLRDYVADLPESDVPHYFDAIKYALNDDDPAVQRAAAKVIERSASFTHAVEPLREMVAPGRLEQIQPDVLSQVIRALASLVYEAKELFARREAFRLAYGTIDMDEIFGRTNGVIEANDAPTSLLDIFKLHPPPSREWTAEMRADMLRTLDSIAREAPSPDAQREAQHVTKFVDKSPTPLDQVCIGNFMGNSPEN